MKKRLLAAIACVILLLTTLPTTAFAEGDKAFYIGNAINYADADDSLSSSYLTTQLDNISMEAWVKADTPAEADRYVRVMYNGNSGNSGYGIYIKDNSPIILVGGVVVGTVSEVTLATSKWYHLAAVRNAGVWTMYVNGKAYAPNFNGMSAAPNAIAEGNTFTVGNRADLSENFTGSIDEVRFWTVARNAQQINDNMYIKLQGNETGLRAYYNFDQEGITPGGDNSGITSVTDVAGGDNNLTISGFAMAGNYSNFVSSVKLGTFALDNSAYSVAQGDDRAAIHIVRTDGSEGAVTINYRTTDATASAGTNYTAASGSVTFAEGETTKEISVQILDYSIDTPKTFGLEISAQSGVALGTPNSATVTITPPLTLEGLFAGKFRAGSQIFDCWRTISGNEGEAYNLNVPFGYYNGRNQFTRDELTDRYFMFRETGRTDNGLPVVGLYLYNSDGTPAYVEGKMPVDGDGFVVEGTVALVADEGILFISSDNCGDLGYLISNAAGYNYGDFSYPNPRLHLGSNGISNPDIEELRAFNASDILLESGQILLRFYPNGDNVTCMPENGYLIKNVNEVFVIDASLNPKREGCEFVSWNRNADGSGVTYEPQAEYASNVGINMYAQWRDASITEQQQASPEGVGTTNAAIIGENGTITGTTAEMQYRTAEDANTWNWCTQDETSVPVGEYWVRYAPKEGYAASPAVRAGKVIEPSATPSSNDFAVTDVSTNGGSDGKITHTVTDIAYEYSTNGGSTYQDITGNEISGLSAGSVRIRKKAVENETLASADLVLNVRQPAAATPNADGFIISHVTTNGGNDGSISGLTNKMQYQRPTSSYWYSIYGSALQNIPAGDYKIRYSQTATDLPSFPVILTVKEPFESAPVVGFVRPSVQGGLGAITGTTTAMEYNLVGNTDENGDAKWTDCANISTPVEPGVYSVRYKETSENTPLPEAKVTVGSALPTVEDDRVCANGVALIITGTDDKHSTIYIDSNRNGILDEGEQSLDAAGVTDAPEDNTDLSDMYVYGGSTVSGEYDTQIVMLSGNVFEIVGGGLIADLAGDTNITVKGGNVHTIFGGCDDGVLNGDAHVAVSGGTVYEIYGGSYSAALVGDAYVTISGGEVTTVFGGNHNALLEKNTDLTGNTYVTVSGGSVTDICAGGVDCGVTGNTSLVISGGTVTGDITGGSASGSRTVSVSGAPKIGGGDKGVRLSAFTENRVTISGALTSGARINLIGAASDAEGTVVASAADAAHADTQYFTMTNIALKKVTAGTGAELQIAFTHDAPTVSGTVIYGNGTALVVTGTDVAQSTIYIDVNRNGAVDPGEQSLFAAGVANAPADGSNLTSHIVYGGSTGNVNYDTQIVMLSGGLSALFGGGTGDLTGDTSITVSGGMVTDACGGGLSALVTGNTDVAVTGGTVGRVYGGGKLSDNSVVLATVNGSTNVSISGGTIAEINGGGLFSPVTGSATVTISGGTTTGVRGGNRGDNVDGSVTVDISGGVVEEVSAGDANGTKTLYVSGAPKITSVVLSTFTGNKVIISDALTGAAGDIRLSATGITVDDGTVLATATTAAHADSSKFSVVPAQSYYHLVQDSIEGTVYIAASRSTLTVAPNGGIWNSSAEIKNFTQVYSSTMDVPAPVRTGYTFTGWTRTNNNGTMSTLTAAATYAFGTTDGVTDIITAQWRANSYTVSYDGNKLSGASGSVTGVPSSVNHEYDTEFLLGAAPSLTGYTFGGWYKDAACTQANFLGGAGLSVSNLTAEDGVTVTLYAKWTANSGTAYRVEHYVIDTDGNYSSIATQSSDLFGTSDATLTLADLKAASLEKANGISYSHGEVDGAATTRTTVLPDGSRVIALYYTRERYALTLIAGEGIVQTDGGDIYSYGSAVDTTATVGVGYTWDKWTSSNATLLPDSNLNAYSFSMPAGAVTLTANATLNQYSVSYDVSQRGSITGSVAADYISEYSDTLVTEVGYALPQSITMTMDGQPFTEFTYDSATGAIAIAKNKILGNIVISGACTPISYAVTYDMDGAAAVAAGSYCIEDTGFILPAAPEKTGHTFAGWKVTTGAEGGTGFALNADYAAGSTAPLLNSYGDVTITARWTVDSYVITYDANGGSGTMEEAVATYGVLFELPYCGFTAPDGMRFREWAVDSAAGTKAAAGSEYSFVADTTVYAVWENVPEYHIISGANGIWTEDSGSELCFVSDGDYDEFLGVSVDGAVISADKFISERGSTKVTLKAEYINTLSVGKHTIEISFVYGSAETTFTVKSISDNSSTGDDSQPMLWLVLAVSAVSGLAVSLICCRKRRNG